jgi:hypothetical protein
VIDFGRITGDIRGREWYSGDGLRGKKEGSRDEARRNGGPCPLPGQKLVSPTFPQGWCLRPAKQQPPATFASACPTQGPNNQLDSAQLPLNIQSAIIAQDEVTIIALPISHFIPLLWLALNSYNIIKPHR